MLYIPLHQPSIFYVEVLSNYDVEDLADGNIAIRSISMKRLVLRRQTPFGSQEIVSTTAVSAWVNGSVAHILGEKLPAKAFCTYRIICL